MKRKDIAFLSILLLGSLFRIIVMHNRDLFVDEVYYWRVSQMNSWKNLLLISHWIKDHGILYYAWLKSLAFFVTDIPTLRFSNIVLYIISGGAFYAFFRDRYGWGALIGVLFFSFHRYFVYLSTTLSPYNLALCLTIISVSGLYFLSGRRVSLWTTIFIVMATAGAFYTDYSFFFTLPFYLFFFLFIVRTATEDRKRHVLLIYSLVFVLILPGIAQFIHNINAIQDLFANRYFEPHLFRFVYIMGGMLYLRIAPLLGCIMMLLPALAVLLSKEKKNFFLLYSYVGALTMIFISQRYFFPLFAERYMWFIYFLIIWMMTCSLKGKGQIGAWVIMLVAIGGIINYYAPVSDMFRAPGDISYEVKYSSLLFNKKNTAAQKVIVLDSTSTSDVLIHYYFGTRYPDTDRYADVVKTLKQKIIILSPRIDAADRILQKLIADKEKSCILYHIAFKKGRREDVLKEDTVRQLGCETVYSLDNRYGYIDSFRLIYSK